MEHNITLRRKCLVGSPKRKSAFSSSERGTRRLWGEPVCEPRSRAYLANLMVFVVKTTWVSINVKLRKIEALHNKLVFSATWTSIPEALTFSHTYSRKTFSWRIPLPLINLLLIEISPCLCFPSFFSPLLNNDFMKRERSLYEELYVVMKQVKLFFRLCVFISC